MNEIFENVARIWRDDQIAFLAAFFLIGLQLLFLVECARRTLWRLRKSRVTLSLVTDQLKARRFEHAEQLAINAEPALKRAWRSVFASKGTAQVDEDSESVDVAFQSDRVLPVTYNQRLDAAAPGLFTAMGILGTFLGLIFGFLRIDPGQAIEGVSPLLGGMVVAFFNSLIGVFLSICWAMASRGSRHRFDQVVSGLVEQLSEVVRPVRSGRRVVARLEDIAKYNASIAERLVTLNAGIEEIGRATKTSTEYLLENLGTRIGDSVWSIAQRPFDELANTVSRFDEVVRQATDRQAEMQRSIEASVAQLVQADANMRSVVDVVRQAIEEFALGVLQLREATSAADSIVDRTHAASTALTGVVEEVERAASRYDETGAQLGRLGEAVAAASSQMSSAAETFTNASAHLDAAVATIQAASNEAVARSGDAMRAEIAAAVGQVVDGLRAVGDSTLEAYESSSEKVVQAVDARMSDLTDRLAAELGTLGDRIPEQMDSLQSAMKSIRSQLRETSRHLTDALRQLGEATPQALSTHLTEYDKALSRSIEHFSGTLDEWSSKVDAIHRFTEEIKRVKPGSLRMVVDTSAPELAQ